MSDIISINSINNLNNIINNISSNNKLLILVDIDDTIISPVSNQVYIDNLFIIDYIKSLKSNTNDPKLIEQYNLKISEWRSNRKVKLTENTWPRILSNLKANPNNTVYALTSIDTGVFCNIPSMEEWRFNELNNLNISFTNNIAGETQSILLPDINKLISKIPMHSYSCFYNGIIMTGKYSKSEVLNSVLKKAKEHNISYDHIIFIDDRLEKLEEINSYCNNNNISVTLVNYKPNITQNKINSDISKIQIDYLLNKSIWLEHNDVSIADA